MCVCVCVCVGVWVGVWVGGWVGDWSYLFQCNGHSSYDVVVGTSLKTREDCSIDLLLVVILYLLALFVDSLDAFAIEDETSARATQRLVGSCGYNIAVLKWTGMHLQERIMVCSKVI